MPKEHLAVLTQSPKHVRSINTAVQDERPTIDKPFRLDATITVATHLRGRSVAPHETLQSKQRVDRSEF